MITVCGDSYAGILMVALYPIGIPFFLIGKLFRCIALLRCSFHFEGGEGGAP